MLSFEEIKKHYSGQEALNPRMMLKEYLQYKILEIVFASKFGHRLVFMGGTCLRIAFGNDRFSEDLDIDNCGLSQIEFGELMLIIKKELEHEGLMVEVRNTFQNVFHCYLKFPALLFESRLTALKEEKILIRIDSFCSREKLAIENKIISKADVFSEIRVYPPSIILAQKIGAAFGRERAKGRDLYDIVYLFSFTRPDWGYLKKFLQIDGPEILRTRLFGLFSEKELKALALDVQPFLINPRKLVQVEKFNLWAKGLKF